MDELDRKLTDIMFSAAGGITDMAQEEIAVVKQAFIDAGWHEHGTQIPDSVARKLNIMTGQEWYDRFKREVDLLDGTRLHGHVTGKSLALEAAKRAAGIK